MDRGAQVDEEVGRDTAGVILVTSPAEEALQAKWPFWRRPEEHVPVHRLGRGVRRNRINPGAGCGVAVVGCTDHGHFGEFAGSNQFLRLLITIRTDAVTPDLHDP